MSDNAAAAAAATDVPRSRAGRDLLSILIWARARRRRMTAAANLSRVPCTIVTGFLGSGKTTLGRLLMKLYEPQQGSILVGGVDMRQYHPHEVRRVVGLLGQVEEILKNL